MIRTQISLESELYDRAKSLARLQGISFAELCRRSLSQTLSQAPDDHPWMTFVGALEGRPGDSRSVDEVVYGRDVP